MRNWVVLYQRGVCLGKGSPGQVPLLHRGFVTSPHKRGQGGGSAPTSLPVPCGGAQGCGWASPGSPRQDELLQPVLETQNKRGHPSQSSLPPDSPKPFTWVCPCPTAPGRASGWCKYLYHHPRRAGDAGMLLCQPAGVKVQKEKPLLGNVVALRLMPRASAVHKGGSANKTETRGWLPHHEPKTPLPYQSLTLVPALPTDPSGVPLPRASPGPSPAHRSVGLGSIQKPCADFILSLTEL